MNILKKRKLNNFMPFNIISENEFYNIIIYLNSKEIIKLKSINKYFNNFISNNKLINNYFKNLINKRYSLGKITNIIQFNNSNICNWLKIYNQGEDLFWKKYYTKLICYQYYNTNKSFIGHLWHSTYILNKKDKSNFIISSIIKTIFFIRNHIKNDRKFYENNKILKTKYKKFIFYLNKGLYKFIKNLKNKNNLILLPFLNEIDFNKF